MEETTGSRLYVAYWFKTKQTVKAFSLMSWRGAADRGYWPVSKWKITSHKELSGACWPCDDELKAMGSSVTAWPLQRVVRTHRAPAETVCLTRRERRAACQTTSRLLPLLMALNAAKYTLTCIHRADKRNLGRRRRSSGPRSPSAQGGLMGGGWSGK